MQVCLYDLERKAPQIDIDISSFMPGASAGFGHGAGSGSGAGGIGDTYVISGTCGHLRASARKVCREAPDNMRRLTVLSMHPFQSHFTNQPSESYATHNAG